MLKFATQPAPSRPHGVGRPIRTARNATGGYIRLYKADRDGIYANGAWSAEGADMAASRSTPAVTSGAFHRAGARFDRIASTPATPAVHPAAAADSCATATRRMAPYFAHRDIDVPGPSSRTARSSGAPACTARAAFDAKVGPAQLLFGFTEFVDDDRVLRRDRGRARGPGRDAALAVSSGPSNLLPNQSGGVITSGFARPRLRRLPRTTSRTTPSVYERHGFDACVRGRDVGRAATCCVTRAPVEELFLFDDDRIAARTARRPARSIAAA